MSTPPPNFREHVLETVFVELWFGARGDFSERDGGVPGSGLLEKSLPRVRALCALCLEVEIYAG